MVAGVEEHALLISWDLSIHGIKSISRSSTKTTMHPLFVLRLP